MSVLIVDDARTIRSIQKRTLPEVGHTDIVGAEDGVQALAKFSEKVPDLVLIDWNMPNRNGNCSSWMTPKPTASSRIKSGLCSGA